MHSLEAGAAIADPLAPYARVDRRLPDGRCWVMANMVGGLDGTAAFGGRVGPLSEGADALLFRRLRSVADVVLVGAETVRRERYGPVRLTDDLREARTADGRPPTPPLAIVSRSLQIDWTVPAFAEAEPHARPLVLTSADADPSRVDEAGRHAEVIVAGAQRVSMPEAVGQLAARGHRVVLCEGGPTLLGEIAAADLLDELCLTLAPLMGGDELPIAVTPPGAGITALQLAHVAAEEDTVFLRYERATDGS